MAWMVGIDEAGYGPTLGPLVIGASLWKLPDDCSRRTKSGSPDDFEEWSTGIEIDGLTRIRIADSKKLYSPASGLLALEASLWGAIHAIPWYPKSFHELMDQLTRKAHDLGDPWYLQWTPQSTRQLEVSDLENVREQVNKHWAVARCRLHGLAARTVQPSEFNTLCDRRGNKATVLTELSLELAKQFLDDHAGEDFEFFCDKHGGRSYYSAALLHYWPTAMIREVKESKDHSRYQLMHSDGSVSVWNFTAKGDSHVPTALASMIAKYLRERMMEAFNAYWLGRLPGLRPTAGYPADAQRFLDAIETTRQTLGIKLETLRRSR